MSGTKIHPLAELALGALEHTGKKALTRLAEEGVPGVVDGILEDVEAITDVVQTRTKTARARIAARKRRQVPR